MSIQHIAMVLEAKGLCAQEKAVLTAFCNHTDPAGKTHAGEERLMREAGMPRTTFQRWRGKLVKDRLLISRRKGRQGGGRTTSDTWVNLKLLHSIRDPWFDRKPADRQEEPNPFDAQNQDEKDTGNGPASGAKGGGNGPASGAINGPASGADVAPPVEPITLTNPQSEPTTLFATSPLDGDPSVDAAAPVDVPIREDVEHICKTLADAVEANGSKRPTVTKQWRNEGRLLLDKDGRTVAQVLVAIEWCQGDDFWRSNIMSMPTLRKQYDRLRLAAMRKPQGVGHQAYQNPTDNSGYYAPW